MTTGSPPLFDEERRRRGDAAEADLLRSVPEALRSAPIARRTPLPPALIVDERLVPILDPTSPIAEQYRALRTNLLAMRARALQAGTPARSSLKTLAITSARRGDGKTLTAANVAAVFAEDPASRIVLVDADLRAPSVSGLFGRGASCGPGLTGYLRDGAPYESVVVPTAIKNLFLVPAGSPLDNPTELLASPRLRELVDRLSLEFDFVFFDTPPVLAVTDAAVLGARIDGVVFVVKMNDSERDAVDRSLEALKAAGARVIGAVLTKA
jgi:capsular exopolysaccharide synthesis family protein